MANKHIFNLDKRLNEINDSIEQYIAGNPFSDESIHQHQYLSPIQHHKSFLTLHSIIIHQNINDFEHLFPDFRSRNIFLKKIVIFRIAPDPHQHSHVFDLSPLDLLRHMDKMHDVLNKFNASKYNYRIAKSLDNDDDYQQYLYSCNYIEDIVKENNNNSDYGLINTAASNLYLKTIYKYNMILLPKYYEYNPSTKLYIDLDTKMFNTYCRSHTPLFALQTLKLYLDANIVKKYWKSTFDAMYKIYGYIHAQNMQRASNQNVLKHNQDSYTASRIWDSYLFNLHPSMIYIHNHINWSTFIQLYLQIFEITTYHKHSSYDNILMNPQPVYFTENDLNDSNTIALHIKIHPSGYRDDDGINDNVQYLAPEFLAHFDPNPSIKRKSKQDSTASNTKPIAYRVTSLSLHSRPMSYSELSQLKQSLPSYTNHKTDPLLLNDVSSECIDETAENDDAICNAFLAQSTTVFNDDLYDDDINDGGAVISDQDTKDNLLNDLQNNNEVQTPIISESVSKTHLKQAVKPRKDVHYLPDLWCLSANIFAAGVMFFVLMNGYPPFERASMKDRWYKEIVKRKYHRFWKLHRASPINAIAIPSAPISFTPSTLNILSPIIINKVFNPKNKRNSKHNTAPTLDNYKFMMKQSSVSAHDISLNNLNSPTSPNTVISVNAAVFGDTASVSRGLPRNRAQTEAKSHIEAAKSTRNVYTESEMDGNKRKKKKKERVEYDYRSVQGLVNDTLRYDSCTRLNAFFSYNHDVKPVYHKYWFLDIGYNEDEELVAPTYDVSAHLMDNEHDWNDEKYIDSKEILFLNTLHKLRYEKQEESRKKSRKMGDEYVSSCICWMMDKNTNDPLEYHTAHAMMEGLCLFGAGEMYTIKPWAKVLHSMYHIIQDNCCGIVEKEYTKTHKRLLCRIKLAKRNEQKENDEETKENNDRLVIFEITIWKSVKWKELNTKEDTIWLVQWRRLYGYYLDYVRVINRIVHDQCAKLFYLSSTIRRAMKPNIKIGCI